MASQPERSKTPIDPRLQTKLLHSPSTKVQRWSVGKLVTERDLFALSKETFFSFLSTIPTGTRANATMLHDLKEFHSFGPFPRLNVCSLASATIHAAFETPRPPRANLTLPSPRHCNNTAID